jgi:exopolyphosphatase/guanosine-5'-triphosphate,3'-diphosphate pyrophosphatase
MRYGVLDLGSNTFHALVADVDVDGIRRVIFDESSVLRIGEHADQPGGISQLMLQRATHAIGELVERAQQRTDRQLRVVATGALRDTENGRRFLASAGPRAGVSIDLISGDDEARLTWLGVSTELAGSHGRLAVLDLGGGSFEVAAGSAAVTYTCSVPLGVLRLRDLSTTALRDAVEQGTAGAVHELLDYKPETLALTSGTARALLRVGRRLGIIGEEQRHVASGVFLELASRLSQLPQAAVLELGVSRARCDTIAAGAAMFATVLSRLARPVVYVARAALREGALVDMARRTPDGDRVSVHDLAARTIAMPR